MPDPIAPVISPCVKRCQLDGSRSYCVSCGRTLEEVGRWSVMTEAERAGVVARLARMRSGS